MSDPSGGGEGGGWELVYEARHHAEAGLVRGLLEAEGIVVMSRGKYGLPYLGSAEPVLLLVPAEQLAAATELITAYLETPHEPEEDPHALQ